LLAGQAGRPRSGSRSLRQGGEGLRRRPLQGRGAIGGRDRKGAPRRNCLVSRTVGIANGGNPALATCTHVARPTIPTIRPTSDPKVTRYEWTVTTESVLVRFRKPAPIVDPWVRASLKASVTGH